MYRVEGIGQVFSGHLFPVEICWYVDTGSQEWWYYASGSGVAVTVGAAIIMTHADDGMERDRDQNFVLTAGDLNSVPWINHRKGAVLA